MVRQALLAVFGMSGASVVTVLPTAGSRVACFVGADGMGDDVRPDSCCGRSLVWRFLGGLLQREQEMHSDVEL